MSRADLFRLAAKDMAQMLHSDSHIPLGTSLPVIFAALTLDDKLPSLYEKECLVFGGPLQAEVNDDQPETHGEGNPTVDAKFPRTCAAISSLF